MASPDVVIVGGGLAGLVSAAQLAGEGMEVVLIEQNQDVGGRLQGLEREGFRLDGGLHCFDYGEAGAIGDLNRTMELGLEFLSGQDSSYILVGKQRFPVGPAADTSNNEFPGWSEEETGRVKALLSALFGADSSEWEEKSLAEFLENNGFAQDELLASYASALGLTVLCHNLDTVSAGRVISRVKDAGDPGFKVEAIAGGPSRLVEALSNLIHEKKVKLCLGAKVLKIETDEKNVTSLTTTSEDLSPAAVIYTGPPQALAEVLPAKKDLQNLRRKCTRLVPVTGVTLDLGLSARVSETAGVLLDPGEGVIGRFPSNLDPSLAPEGAQLSSWMALVPATEFSDVNAMGSHIRRLKRVIQRHFPEIDKHIRLERLRAAPAISAVAPLKTQAAKKRPTVFSRQLGNFFMAGDGLAAQGSGSGAAIATAQEAVQKVRKLLKDS